MTIATRLWRRYAGLFRSMLEVAPRLTIGLIGVTVVRAVAPIGFVVSIAVVVSQVPATVRAGFDSTPGSWLVIAAVTMGVTFFLQQFAPAVERLIGYRLSRAINVAHEQRIIRVVLSPPSMSHVQDRETQDAISVAVRSFTGWPQPGEAARALAGRVAAQLLVVGGGLLMLLVHWWVALLGVVVITFLQVRTISTLGLIAEAQTGQALQMRRWSYLRELALAPRGAKELRVFGLGKWLVDKYDRERSASASDLASHLRDGRRRTYLAASLGWLYFVGALLLLGWEAGTGKLTIAEVAIAAQAIITMARPLTDENGLRDALILALALQSLEAVKRTEQLVAAAASTNGRGGTVDPGRRPVHEIRFEGVSFTYPGQQTPVFDHLDLTIPAGGSLAIVGSNGAGKTTLVKLLCGFYTPDEGRITVDGIDLTDLDLAQWQRRIAAVFQDFVRYPLSLRENVQLGDDAHPDGEMLHAVATRVGIERFAEELSAGWDTVLSSEYTGGTDLSGGQWQRVALARAVHAAATGATVLVMDEPTASLDVRGEAEIYDRFLDLTTGVTTLLISHRFSTVRRADQICVLEHGTVVEIGAHDELLERGGRYAELFTLQADRFADEVDA